MTKSKKTKLDTIPEKIQEALEAVAKGVGIAATELWKIFARQYFMYGVANAFGGVSATIAAFALRKEIGLWFLVPLAGAHLLFYWAIMMMGNPKYYALNDITNRVKGFMDGNSTEKPKSVKTSKSNYSTYY